MKALMSGLLFLAMAAPAGAGNYALLVGINQYQALGPDLEGCENDVKRMREALTTHFQVPEENVAVLLNEQATAAGIVAAFKEKLIARSRPGDHVFFYYSGHGSQVPDANGDETDQKDEVLCPTDIARDKDNRPVNIVSDDMLGELIKGLDGRQFVAVFDCCHSGTGTRDVLVEGRVRFMPLEGSAPAAQGSEAFAEAATRAVGSERAAGVPAYVELRQGEGAEKAVLVAACRSDEKAQETEFEMGGKMENHGALTVKLLKAFQGEAAGKGKTLTVDALQKFLEDPYFSEKLGQHPQLECAREMLSQPFLGSPGAGTVTPPQTGAPEPPRTAVRPLRVFVAPGETFLNTANVKTDPAAGDQLRDILKTERFIQLVDQREASDVAVFYAAPAGGGAGFDAGTLLASGTVSVRLEKVALEAGSLEPLLKELRRLYLVDNLVNLRNPGSRFDVKVELAGGGRRLKLGEPIRFRITSARQGFITLINVDNQGGLNLLVPNEYSKQYPIAAGGARDIPEGEFELEVIPPTGLEFVKAFVTERPLLLPVLSQAPAHGGFRSIDSDMAADDFIKGVGVKPKAKPAQDSAAGGESAGVPLEALAPEQWGDAALTFETG